MNDNFNPEKLLHVAQQMRGLADLINRACTVAVETHSQLEAFDRFMTHHVELIKAAEAGNAEDFIKRIMPAYQAAHVILSGLRNNQIQINLGGA